MTAIAALSILPTVATAESRQGSGDEPIDTVTVEAERVRLERQISHFVTDLALHSRNDALARWQLPICPLVAGLSFEQGKSVFQRVSQIASEAGIALAPIECKPEPHHRDDTRAGRAVEEVVEQSDSTVQ